ncbi:MAG: hypothetical protein ACRC7Q_02940, partial [Plesiomonas shigelloides]
EADRVSEAQKVRLDALYRLSATEEPPAQLDARVMAMVIARAEIRHQRTRKTDRPKPHRPYIISTIASLLFLGLLVVFYPELVPLGRQLVTPAAQVDGQQDAGLAPVAARNMAFEPAVQPASARRGQDPVELGLQALDVAIKQGNKPLFDALFVAFERKAYALTRAQQLRLDELRRLAAAKSN